MPLRLQRRRTRALRVEGRERNVELRVGACTLSSPPHQTLPPRMPAVRAVVLAALMATSRGVGLAGRVGSSQIGGLGVCSAETPCLPWPDDNSDEAAPQIAGGRGEGDEPFGGGVRVQRSAPHLHRRKARAAEARVCTYAHGTDAAAAAHWMGARSHSMLRVSSFHVLDAI